MGGSGPEQGAFAWLASEPSARGGSSTGQGRPGAPPAPGGGGARGTTRGRARRREPVRTMPSSAGAPLPADNELWDVHVAARFLGRSVSWVYHKAEDWGLWEEGKRPPTVKVDIGKRSYRFEKKILSWDQTAAVLARLAEPDGHETVPKPRGTTDRVSPALVQPGLVSGKKNAGSIPIDWSTCHAWSCSASIWARVGRPAVRSGRPSRDRT